MRDYIMDLNCFAGLLSKVWDFLCKCQSVVIGVILWENCINIALLWHCYYAILSLSNGLTWMHPAYEKASFDGIGVILGNLWLYIGAEFVYFEGIWILQPTRAL